MERAANAAGSAKRDIKPPVCAKKLNVENKVKKWQSIWPDFCCLQ